MAWELSRFFVFLFFFLEASCTILCGCGCGIVCVHLCLGDLVLVFFMNAGISCQPTSTVNMSEPVTNMLVHLTRGRHRRGNSPHGDRHPANLALHAGQSAGPVPPYQRGWTSSGGEYQTLDPRFSLWIHEQTFLVAGNHTTVLWACGALFCSLSIFIKYLSCKGFIKLGLKHTWPDHTSHHSDSQHSAEMQYSLCQWRSGPCLGSGWPLYGR